MPVRNAARYLREAMASVLSQTFPNFEMVVVDDESTDASSQILEEFETGDSRVQVRRRRSEGLVAALNYGCSLARAPYIARMDADDVAFPERLERQLAFLHEHPDVALLGTAHTEIDESGNLLGTTVYPTSIEAVAQRLPVKNCLAHPTVVFSRAVFREVGGYRAALPHAEDYDLWLRIGDRHEIANLDEPLLAYRLHPASISVTNRRQQVLSTLAAQAATRARRAGADDGLGGESVVTLEVLQRLGVSRPEVARNVFVTCSSQAERALAGGHDRLALDFCADALACGRDMRLTRAQRAHVHRIAAIAAFNEGMFRESAASLARGIATRPSLVGGVLRRGVRSTRGQIPLWIRTARSGTSGRYQGL
jgi:hypothetical protein